jgi:hypothetical protein
MYVLVDGQEAWRFQLSPALGGELASLSFRQLNGYYPYPPETEFDAWNSGENQIAHYVWPIELGRTRNSYRGRSLLTS